MLAARGESEVVYSCPQLCGKWTPTEFTLDLQVTAGGPGCQTEAGARTSVTVLDKPEVTVTAPREPVLVCAASFEDGVNVTFAVQATSPVGLVVVPNQITTNDMRVCVLPDAAGDSTTGGCCAGPQQRLLIAALFYTASNVQNVLHTAYVQHTEHLSRRLVKLTVHAFMG
jgi:hypothetical protein